MITPTLYRGDSLPNTQRNFSDPAEKGRTWAEHYKTEGLMAKYNSGGPGNLWNHDLAYLVASHVGYQRHPDPKQVTQEQYFSNKSPFISFSTDPDKAGYFMDRTERAKLIQADLADATHFLWKFDPIDSIQNRPGWYSFTYQASIENVTQFLRQDLHELNTKGHEMDMDEIGHKLGAIIASANTNADNNPHRADLIDVVTFLKNSDVSKIDPGLIQRAIDRSAEDDEWLLFPKDPFDGGGYDSRFTLNKHLNLHYWATRLRGT